MGGGLRLLTRLALSKRVANIFIPASFVIMFMLVMAFHVDEPGEDYMACKCFGGIFMPFIAVFLTAVLLSAEICGNSFMRSLPISPGLYQKAVPLFTAAYPAALLTLVNIAYAIFITATGRASANIADMLTLGGIAQLLFSVPVCLTLCGCRPAFFAAYFLVFSCFGILVGYVDSFGVGVGAGLLIFAGALSVSFVANMVIGKAYYKKATHKQRQSIIHPIFTNDT